MDARRNINEFFNCPCTITGIEHLIDHAESLNDAAPSSESFNSYDDIGQKRDTPLIRLKLDMLPRELLWKIFSKLTFLECIRCASLNKTLRSAVLCCPNIANTISNEGRLHELARRLSIYKPCIRKSSIRVLDLTINNITERTHSVATNDLMMLMNLLKRWGCDSIQKGIVCAFTYNHYLVDFRTALNPVIYL